MLLVVVVSRLFMNIGMLEPKVSTELFPLSSKDCFDSAKLKKLRRSQSAQVHQAEQRRAVQWQSLQHKHGTLATGKDVASAPSPNNASVASPKPIQRAQRRPPLAMLRKAGAASESATSRQSKQQQQGPLPSLAFLSRNAAPPLRPYPRSIRQSKTAAATSGASLTNSSRTSSTHAQQQQQSHAETTYHKQLKHVTVTTTPSDMMPPSVVLTTVGSTDDDDQWSESQESSALLHLSSLYQTGHSVDTPRAAVSKRSRSGRNSRSSGSSKATTKQTDGSFSRTAFILLQIFIVVAIGASASLFAVLTQEYYAVVSPDAAVLESSRLAATDGVVSSGKILHAVMMPQTQAVPLEPDTTTTEAKTTLAEPNVEQETSNEPLFVSEWDTMIDFEPQETLETEVSEKRTLSEQVHVPIFVLPKCQDNDRWNMTMLSQDSRDDFVSLVQSNYWKRPFTKTRSATTAAVSGSSSSDAPAWRTASESVAADLGRFKFVARLFNVVATNECRSLEQVMRNFDYSGSLVNAAASGGALHLDQMPPLSKVVGDFLQEQRQFKKAV